MQIMNVCGMPGVGMNLVYKYLEHALINYYCMRQMLMIGQSMKLDSIVHRWLCMEDQFCDMCGSNVEIKTFVL